MKKKESNLHTYCISHEFNKNLDKLDIKIIGSGAFKKKFNIWFVDINLLDMGKCKLISFIN